MTGRQDPRDLRPRLRDLLGDVPCRIWILQYPLQQLQPFPVPIGDDVSDTPPVDPTPLTVSGEYVDELALDVSRVCLRYLIESELVPGLPSPCLNEAGELGVEE